MTLRTAILIAVAFGVGISPSYARSRSDQPVITLRCLNDTQTLDIALDVGRKTFSDDLIEPCPSRTETVCHQRSNGAINSVTTDEISFGNPGFTFNRSTHTLRGNNGISVGGVYGCVNAHITLSAEPAPIPSVPLPDTDQDQIAEVLILYSGHNPKTYLGANRVTQGYLSVQGHDPSPVPLQDLRKSGFMYQPGSQWKLGDGYIVAIGTFGASPSGEVTGPIQAFCGGTCGAHETYVMKKVGERWTVDSFLMDWIS